MYTSSYSYDVKNNQNMLLSPPQCTRLCMPVTSSLMSPLVYTATTRIYQTDQISTKFIAK